MTTKKRPVTIYSARLLPLSTKTCKVTQKRKRKNKVEEKKMHLPITKMLTKLRKQHVDRNNIFSPKKKNITKEFILDGIIINYPRAVKLLSFLEKHKDSIYWNDSKQIILFGQTIQGSDIIDILNALLTPNVNLNNIPGAFLFLEALKYIRAPSSLVVNTQAKKNLQ